MDLSDLNEEQLKAVTTIEGPVLVLAGAGSGKTKVLTTRIAYLIDYGVSPYNILAITFTNKAAGEMKGRIIDLVGSVAKSMQISTFHSFGVRVLKENYDLLGYKDNFSILDADDSLTVVKTILKELNLDPKKYNARGIRNTISNYKNELISPEMAKKFVNSDFDELVVDIYKRYESKLKTGNSVDFDDLLLLPIELFKKNKSALEHYQNRYKYILVDEYQDTNEAQYILTKMIADKYKNICVVGDPDQSIYSFRGANYKNILNFERDYKDAKVITLEENYRSTKTILDAANSVIKNNKNRKEKNLRSTKGDGDKITYYRAYDGKDEANYCIDEVKKLLDSGVEKQDIAILYRTNAQSRILEEAFLRSNIPYRVVGSYYFYGRKEIKDLLAYLKLIHNPSDNVSLLRIINEPKRGIGDKTIAYIQDMADSTNSSLYDAISGGKELEFKRIIEELIEDAKSCTLTELVDKVLSKSGLRQDLEKEKSLEGEIKLENLEEFKSITKDFEDREGSVSLEEFLMETSLVSDIEDYRNDPNRVSLMTVHSVKGLEFDYVFVTGLEEGLFPHVNSLESSNELEEERRLAYVAITRAKKKLYLVNARQRVIFGQDQINVVSRFIEEIDKDFIEEVGPNIVEKETVIPHSKEEMYKTEEFDIKKGDFVFHEDFGVGKVLDVNGSLATISFKGGTKILMKNHRKLSKEL